MCVYVCIYTDMHYIILENENIYQESVFHSFLFLHLPLLLGSGVWAPTMYTEGEGGG